jgi:hypothetical protein
MARVSASRIWIGCLAVAALGCSAPRQNGKPVDASQFARAEGRCQQEAISRYGAPPPGAPRGDDQCDAQSWLCRKTQAWMLKEGNPLSTATSRDRLVYEYTQSCLQKQGFRTP